MPDSASAIDILERPGDWELGSPSLVVLVGDEPFLTLHVLSMLRDRLCPDEADRAWAWREFSGDADLDPRDVFDEAATVPLFAGATRAAVVRAADGFVSASRETLEKIAGGPRAAGHGLVILEVKSMPANTRLAKAVAKHGLMIDVSIPPRANLAAWVRHWAQSRHGIQVAAATAQRLLERLGNDLGQVDQALARLAAAIDPADRKKAIPPEAVDDFAGSQQERTAWGMIDSATAGDAREAVAQLAALLDAGENPIGISAQIALVLRPTDKTLDLHVGRLRLRRHHELELDLLDPVRTHADAVGRRLQIVRELIRGPALLPALEFQDLEAAVLHDERVHGADERRQHLAGLGVHHVHAERNLDGADLIGHRHAGHVLHGGMGKDQVLDFLGADLLATAVDQVLAASFDDIVA